MKKIILGILVTIMFLSSSCNDWFDVTPKSEIRGEDHYSTVTGFQQTLIGCYVGMIDDNLYGKYLSWHMTEILAHQFQPIPSTTTTSLDYRLFYYTYGTSDVNEALSSIWAKSYNVIVNANEALVYIEKNRSVLDDINYHVIKGELLAIRAYMHFDLLRLYGYGDWENRASELNEKLTIPYVKTVSPNATQRLSGRETFNLIMADLNEAESLLKEYDPITRVHDESFYFEVNSDYFFNNRTLRMNYYAVKGLQARMLLWEGSNDSKTKALSAASEVISLVESGGVILDTLNTALLPLDANEIGSSNSSLAVENLFGLNVPTLQNKILDYIRPVYLDTDLSAMYISESEAPIIYENEVSDVRYSKLLVQNSNPNTSSRGYVPLKVYQSNLSDSYKSKISMIRIPELYYIAAECYATGTNPNLEEAMSLLNTMRERRGVYSKLESLDKEQVIDEIKKEYRKEFLSEGVMFYYYKRTGAINVPNNDEVMTDNEYVLPNPEFK